MTHRNEFPTGYSLAGCSAARPASASPAALILNRKQLVRQQFSANGNCSLLPLSQFTAQSITLGWALLSRKGFTDRLVRRMPDEKRLIGSDTRAKLDLPQND